MMLLLLETSDATFQIVIAKEVGRPADRIANDVGSQTTVKGGNALFMAVYFADHAD